MDLNDLKQLPPTDYLSLVVELAALFSKINGEKERADFIGSVQDGMLTYEYTDVFAKFGFKESNIFYGVLMLDFRGDELVNLSALSILQGGFKNSRSKKRLRHLLANFSNIAEHEGIAITTLIPGKKYLLELGEKTVTFGLAHNHQGPFIYTWVTRTDLYEEFCSVDL